MCYAYMYGLGGAENGKRVKKRMGFYCIFEGSEKQKAEAENELLAEKWRLGGGRGRVNPPPRRLVRRFSKVRECIYTPRGNPPNS